MQPASGTADNGIMRPFTLKTAQYYGTAQEQHDRKDGYDGQIIRGLVDWNTTRTDSSLKILWDSPELGFAVKDKGYLDMITYNFQWDPSAIMPQPGGDGVGSPCYFLMYIVKLKNPLRATIAQNNDGNSGSTNLNVVSGEHLLDSNGSLDSTKLQHNVHYTIGVGDTNVILNDKYFDVKEKWNLSYNMKSIQSLNLPGNAILQWRWQLPGGHRKLHRQQDYISKETGGPWTNTTSDVMQAMTADITTGAEGISNLNPNPNEPLLDYAPTGSGTTLKTAAMNKSWLRFNPSMVEWEDQYHILCFTTLKAGQGETITGKLKCRMDYTFSTK